MQIKALQGRNIPSSHFSHPLVIYCSISKDGSLQLTHPCFHKTIPFLSLDKTTGIRIHGMHENWNYCVENYLRDWKVTCEEPWHLVKPYRLAKSFNWYSKVHKSFRSTLTLFMELSQLPSNTHPILPFIPVMPYIWQAVQRQTFGVTAMT